MNNPKAQNKLDGFVSRGGGRRMVKGLENQLRLCGIRSTGGKLPKINSFDIMNTYLDEPSWTTLG